MVMISRRLPVVAKSFFLLGPRGTGKSTWLRSHYPQAKWFNLLKNIELLRLMQDPELFRKEVEILSPGSWVIIDEIQRHPALLNEVHDLLASHPKGHYLFALTGSSARKLKRSGVNLMAGRAVQKKMFSFVSSELGSDFKIETLLKFGSLPECWLSDTDQDRIEFLESYLDTYLREEIKEEALVRKLEPFSRFLKVASIMNGQQVNLAALARDAGVSRPTAQGYFEVLEDTLIGFWLPSWRPKVKVKEVANSKFYFFDPGVVRALAGKLRETLSETDRGFLLETFLLNEIQAYISYNGIGGNIFYWRTPSGTEIDLIFESATDSKIRIGFEFKSSKRWKSEYSRPLAEMIEDGILQKGYGVYLGGTAQLDRGVKIYDLATFLSLLWDGKILPEISFQK
jgi:predicted AAA+ superfamily ATPase